MRLRQQVAIVTGGGQGIGRAIVHAFAQEGAAAIIADQNAASGEKTRAEVVAAGGDARFVAVNVADRAAVEALVQTTLEFYGRIDILVNNAAILGENGPFLEVSQATWDRVIAVNQTGVFIGSQVVGRVMAQARRGSIINISSVNAQVPQPRCVAYAAAKAAVESLTRSLAIDLAPYGIRANCIAPGPIQSHTSDHEPAQASDLVLLGRAGLPAEIAKVAVFLASDESSYMTGASIAVDGGHLINGYRLYGVECTQA